MKAAPKKLPMTEPRPPDELFERVQSAFNAVDPEGLLRLGFPEDEYNPEVKEICRRKG